MGPGEKIVFTMVILLNSAYLYLKQNEAQSARVESTLKGVN